MQLKKAQIKVLEGDKNTIDVMYNPTELSLTTKVGTSGTGADVQPNMRSHDNFTVSLFFDTYEQQTDVRKVTAAIADLTKLTVGTGNKRSPPRCMFQWGSFSYVGIVVNIIEHFTLFLPSGIPVRENMDVTFQETLTAQEQEEDNGLPNCLRQWTVTMNDRLDQIAWRALGDANLWPLIAEANDIDDALLFPQPTDYGRQLLIPDVWGAHGGGIAHAAR